MKRTLIAIATLLVAGSLAAATETPAPIHDSPLVAAAKKRNRKVKKGIVITDATVKNSTGHLSVTTGQHEVISTPEKHPEGDSAESKEKERAANREKAAAEAKQRESTRRAATAEDNQLYNEDPSPPPTSTSSQPQPSKPHDSQRP